MSDEIKWGDSYDNVTENMLPTLEKSRISADKDTKTDKIKWGETYESLAANVLEKIQKSPVVIGTYSTSGYPAWWNTTITIYNRYEDAVTQLVTWYRHVIPNCFFQNTYNVSIGNQTVARVNETITRIPESTMYKDYAEWYQGEKIELPNYFTLQQGDIIIRGVVDDVINENKKGMYSTDLISKYRKLGICTVVKAFQDNTGGGRGTPHYKAIGD